MKIKIIKGTNQIGGCITEITSEKGTKIMIDYGDNLDDKKQWIIPGLTIKDDLESKYDGVVITHSHKDHIGCAALIKKEIPIYLDRDGKEIHNNLCYFTKEYEKILRAKDHTLRYFEFGKKFFIQEIAITPWIVDHSNYNSAMLCIEVDGVKILHTGDYRNHGKKGYLFTKTLEQIGKVDVLITEGTTLGSKDRIFKNEMDLSKDFHQLLNYDQIYVMCSSTNVDRIVNLYNNFKKTHMFITDLCMNKITSLLKNIPNSNTFPDVFTFVSPNQRKIEEPYVRIMNHTKNVIKELPFERRFIASIKPSMWDYIKENKDKIKNACLIYSMWDGYIRKDWKDPKQREFVKYLVDELHMGFAKIHTSGHASKKAIQLLDEKVNPEKVIVIHSEKTEDALKIEKEIFKERLWDCQDGETLEFESSKKQSHRKTQSVCTSGKKE